MALCGAETWTLRKSDQKYLGSFEMWCWRKMEKFNWIHRVRNEEVSHTVREERNVVQTIKRRKAHWIGHTLRRNCLLNHVAEGKIQGRIEVRRIRRTRRRQLLDVLDEKRGFCKLKDTTRSHSVETSLWKRLWTYRKINNRINDICYLVR
jgi:hypothetical protein